MEVKRHAAKQTLSALDSATSSIAVWLRWTHESVCKGPLLSNYTCDVYGILLQMTAALRNRAAVYQKLHMLKEKMHRKREQRKA